ncbi:GNAT family N-acetyltransferase [Ornithinibacillus bavariensis]|uniref:N-acetyltransferase YbbJ n=1 Tax=Ornithinibacillus bavariensis TaxID=545502 RepID=A0A919X831_9BACI|nr:GNAT family N-acetyltransferase [Ornithinibacillus bavariensis]GIO27529.1 putative N-acetyltransferase YbbJ [Ornithinibacillus bavariensis]
MSIQTTDSVTLDFYSDKYRSRLCDYHLTKEQSRYASVPSEVLETCKEDDSKYPVIILYNGEPAGFFVLHGWEGVQTYSDNRDAILLRSYSVNSRFQGKGIAKQSLHALGSFVKQHFPKKTEIILAVNHQNTIAQHVYKRSGFIDKGVRKMGPKGELYILQKEL